MASRPSKTASLPAPSVADAHSDLLSELALRRGEPRAFERRWLGELRRGGVRLQVCAVFAALADDPRAEALAQVEAFERAASESSPDVRVVRTSADLEDDGRVGLVLALEGAEPLGGDVEALDALWARGLRMVAPTWSRANAFGGGSDGDEGLTPLGARLVDRVGELGGVVDLAHASPRTLAEALERVRDGCVVVSHAACRAVHDHPRNLDDAQLRALAARGGVVGILADALLVGDASVDRVVDHVAHAVSVAGEDNVAVGGDFLDQVLRAGVHAHGTLRRLARRVRRNPAVIPELRGPGDYPRLADALDARGLPVERILAGNLLRVLATALPGE